MGEGGRQEEEREGTKEKPGKRQKVRGKRWRREKEEKDKGRD